MNLFGAKSAKVESQLAFDIDPVAACVDSPITFSPAGYDGIKLDVVYGNVEALCHSAAKLYQYSVKSCMHVEGLATLWAIQEHVQRYRDKGIARVSDEAIAERVRSVVSLTRDMFSQCEEIGIAVFHGSALRGKISPGDIDLSIGTRTVEFFEDSYEKRSKGRLVRDFVSNWVSLRGKIRELHISAQVFSHYETQHVPVYFARRMVNGSVGVEFVTRSPFLALVPDRLNKSNLLAFFNDAGQRFHEARGV